MSRLSVESAESASGSGRGAASGGTGGSGDAAVMAGNGWLLPDGATVPGAGTT